MLNKAVADKGECVLPHTDGDDNHGPNLNPNPKLTPTPSPRLSPLNHSPTHPLTHPPSDYASVAGLAQQLSELGAHTQTPVVTKPLRAPAQKSEQTQALERAQSFFQALRHNKIEDVGQPTGMRVIHNIPNVRTGRPLNVIIRKITQPYFAECLDKAAGGGRVCALGNPGIGKSTSVSFLIRMIFEKWSDVKVVYDYKGHEWLYEFHSDGKVDVFPRETTPVHRIASLKKSSNFYIVDPGRPRKGSRRDNCNPSEDVVAGVIIVPSLNSDHWGGPDFVKGHEGGLEGIRRYNSVWTLDELKAANEFVLTDPLTDEELLNRFYKFGPIPRHIFAKELSGYEEEQAKGINALTPKKVQQIFMQKIDHLDTNNADQPSSYVMMYRVKENKFGTPSIELVSKKVIEMVAIKYEEQLWGTMVTGLNNSVIGALFEPVVRNRLLKRTTCQYKKARSKKRELKTKDITLGPCTEIRLVADPVESVRDCQDDYILFHSYNPRFPLIDMIYRVGDTYHAFQATIGQTHTANIDAIQSLTEKLELKKRKHFLYIHYAIPANNMDSFRTSPTTPVPSPPPSPSPSTNVSSTTPCYEEVEIAAVSAAAATTCVPVCEVGVVAITRPGEEFRLTSSASVATAVSVSVMVM